MPKRIALDYDDRELRIVVANCNGSKVQVTDAQVIPIPENGSVSEKLRAYITSEGLQKTETLVTIGRGKAELRELQLPPVPDDELPDMVRFQAIRSFASASERAIVDFLVTRRTNENNTLIAAAVSPGDMDRVRELCKTSDLLPKRIALRPLSAASLYLRGQKTPPICVLIDLLNDDAEIVIARDGKVIFVRTVRLPSEARHRSGAIASELHRTMVACGETSTPGRIVVWGTESVHAGDIAAIKSTISCDDVQAVNPFDLVSLQIDRSALPEHIGRLAPLVGLLASDETAPETLIDFLNPRKKPEEEPDRVRRILMIAGPIAAVFLAGFFIYRQFAQWDRKIANATNEVNLLLPSAKAAEESIERTETIDQFLDGDVNWLDEIRRLAEKAPPSDKMIVRNISGTASIRGGGGTLRIVGAVTEPSVIDELEEALRDPNHGVVGKGSQEQKGQDTYAWTFTESVMISGETIRNTRYERMAERIAEAESQAADEPSTATEEPAAEQSPSEAAPSEAQESEDQEAEQQPSTPDQPSNENATDTAEVQA
ncbi:type IV pilus biogenesis protein PilM [Stieleria sp.]|uniref:type IV pilus biogenesis protein PilM n=1 Tax=Stieleria sp. TaxID=2795976 RepID=UPI003567230F